MMDQRNELTCSVFLVVLFLADAVAFPCTPVTRHAGGGGRRSLSETASTVDTSQAVGSSAASAGMIEASIRQALDLAVLARSRFPRKKKPAVAADEISGQKVAPTGVDDCMELLDDSIEQLSDVLEHYSGKGSGQAEDIHTWLSAALTHQETCLDSLNATAPANSALSVELEKRTENLSRLIGNSLAGFVGSERGNQGKNKATEEGGRRRLLSDGFPEWVSAGDRELLEAPAEEIRAHAVVAEDGSGTHGSIREALAFAAALAEGGGGGRKVIRVKAGTYSEGALSIPRKVKDVMLIGDGKDVTVVTGHKSAGSGYTTYNSATLGVSGDGFIARDITFVNSAGPSAQQAVALRVSADRSVIYRCGVEGYQDTLYTLSNRQFYRETDVSGTVDFIFGNSAAVFQSCNIVAKKGASKINFVTAQGRRDPNQNTGISIQSCRISGSSGTNNYLGRPWQKYSRTVIMKTYLDSSINPAGWFPWAGGAERTAYYAEHMNTGPGASTSGRVKWPAVHPSISASEASQFTVSAFISGNQWLPSTGIPFDGGL